MYYKQSPQTRGVYEGAPAMEDSNYRPYYFKCPQCRRNDTFYTVGHEVHTARNLGLFLFGGLDTYVFFSKRGGPQIQCAHCGHVFLQPKSPSSRETKLISAFWVLALLLSLAFAAVYIDPAPSPTLGAIVAGVAGLFTQFYAAYPAATVIVLLLLPIGSIIACMIFDARHRKRDTANYRIAPPPYQPRND